MIKTKLISITYRKIALNETIMENDEILDAKVVEHNQKVESNHLASSGKRFANFIIDLVMIYIIAIILSVLYVYAGINFDKVPSFLIGVILQISYYTILEATTGKTIGKMITRTKVVLSDFSKPSLGSIFKRSLCRIIPFEPLSFFGSSSPSGWHDTITNTWVVDENAI